MATSCAGEILFVAVSWGGSPYTMATGATFALTVQDLAIRGEGVIGPSCRGVIGADLVATVEFLVKPPFDPIGNMNQFRDLVISTKDFMGNAVTHTLHNMAPRSFNWGMHRDQPPATWNQQFAYKGDMATESEAIIP